MVSKTVFKMRSDLAMVRSCAPAISCSKSCLDRGSLVEVVAVDDGGVVEKSDNDDDDDDNNDKYGRTGIGFF
jgi:hypothetical protein